MASSRTVKTLFALFVAMTLGALVLMALETDPIRPTAQPALAVLSPPPAGAALAVYETARPIETERWKYIVLHAAAGSGDPVARQCHFLVRRDGRGGWEAVSTAFWRRQVPSGHIGGYWGQHSIGICLVGDFSRRPPEPGQFARLVELTQRLQEVCRIGFERVYLERDLHAGSHSPGDAFPERAFSKRLLRIR